MIHKLSVSAALVALVFSGCGKKDAATEGETKKEEPPAVAKAPADAPPPPVKPATDEAASAAADGECPARTTLTALDSTKDLAAFGPFDLSEFTHALAGSQKDGAKVIIYLSNRDWSLERYGQLPSPVDTAGDAYLKLTFHSKEGPVTAAVFGENPHTGEAAAYVAASLFVKELSIGVDLGESKAEILGITDTQICGTFALHGKHEMDGRKTHFEGTFVAPLPTK